MRILAITNLYPWAGQELLAPYNQQQFRHLAEEHEMAVIAPVAWTEQVKGWWRGRRVRRRYLNDHGTWVYHPTYFFPPKVLQHQYGKFYLSSISKLAWRLVRDFRPEVVLSSWAHPDGWAAVQIGRRAGLPVVIKVHGSDVLVNTRNARRRRQIAAALCEADGVVAVSQDLADHVVRLGADVTKVHVVYHGTDETVFYPGDQAQARARLGLPRERKMILFVGNLLLSKGTGVLIEACCRLRDRGLPFACYLIGRGSHESTLRALIEQRKLENWVYLAGGYRNDRLPDWYRACDLVVLPSFSEGIPNVLREGLLCGKPFVATDVGGIPELAHPSFSRLVPPGAVPELANAIIEMLAIGPCVEEILVRQRIISWKQSARLLAERLQAAIASRPMPASRCELA
jgi:glycosyltransferase involved in cell wall biosynthesis